MGYIIVFITGVVYGKFFKEINGYIKQIFIELKEQLTEENKD